MAEGREEMIERCPECGSTRIIRDYDRAEIICLNCGLVIKDHMVDPGPEWRAFDEEQRERRTRTGAPTTLMIHDKGLSTVIDWRNKDSTGKNLNLEKRITAYRLRKWQRRVRVSDSVERNMALALAEIDRIASILELPRNVTETAALIYRRAIQDRIAKGRSIESMAAACVYAACRLAKIPRTLDEIAHAARATKKEVGRSYRSLAKTILPKISRVPPAKPTDYVPRLVNQLRLPGEVQTKAIEIIEAASKLGLTSGRGPVGLAAAAIYLACTLLNYKKTQREIAQVAGVTEVTVRNRYKELVEQLNFIIIL
ncbi:MAG: transcription initiation factor IIB [Thermoprotei archaeon]|nr:MAG: transcription initiation factor IIB [Thermoprotei archaeon]